MATYPDLTKINLNQNIFGGYTSPTAANYGQKLNFIKQYYPQYGSTDARSIDMMYNKAVELTNKYGSSQGNKIGSQLAQTLRTAQAGNMQQPIQKESMPITKTDTSSTGSSASTRKTNKPVNTNTGVSNQVTNNTPVVPDSSGNGYTPTGQVDTSAFMNYNNVNSPVIKNPNYNASDAFNFDWKLPNQNGVVPQNNTTTGGYITNSNTNANPLGSLSFADNVGNQNMTPAFATTNGSPMDFLQRMYQPIPKPFNSYSDAWNKGEGITGGISNMWNQFTTENGSLANPTASGLEKTLNAGSSLAGLYNGIMNAKYQKDLIGLANRQQQFQEQQAANVNALQQKAQSNYDSSIVK